MRPKEGLVLYSNKILKIIIAVVFSLRTSVPRLIAAPALAQQPAAVTSR